MPTPMNVDPHVLATSSAEVHAASQRFVAAHAGAAAAIEPALDGWVGLSRAAMSDTVAHWAGSTVAVATRMAEHADAIAGDINFSAVYTQVSPTSKTPEVDASALT